MGTLKFFTQDRIASRILGMGDVVSLVEKASEQIDQDAEKLQKTLKKFSLTTKQLRSNLKNGRSSKPTKISPRNVTS